MGVLSYGPKVLLAIVIPILDSIYHKVAIWLNDMGENKLLAKQVALIPVCHWQDSLFVILLQKIIDWKRLMRTTW